jgi:type I restriction enzyme S subunit
MKSVGNWERLGMKFKLGDICSRLSTGKGISAKLIDDVGKFPVYGGNGLRGYTAQSNFFGECAIIGRQGAFCGNVRYFSGEAYMTEHAIVVCANKDNNTRYLAYLLGIMKLGRLSGQSAQPGLSVKTLAQQDVDMPPLEQQRKVAKILATIEKKIELNNKINENLEQQAVLLFKKWFIEFNNTSRSMIETRFGLIPDSFKLLKNGELPLVVTDYVANGSFASLKANVTLYQEPNYAYFIRNTDLKSGTFEVFVDEHSYNFLSKSTLYGGEIIISNVGDVGSVFLCPKLDKPMTLGNNIIMLRPEQENLRYYLYIWFKWLYGQSLIQGIKGGSAQPKFNKTDFKNLPIFLPPDKLLKQFHQIVKPMFELIDKNSTENQALTITRDALLPKLMSGELDVSNIDI